MQPRYGVPRTIERGVATTLTLPIYDAASVAQTVDTIPGATLTITDGARTVLSAASVTVGPPASYALTAETTEDEPLSDRWLEVWSVYVGGQRYYLRRPAMLVRQAFRPTITDTDLTDRHSDLLALLPSSLTSYEPYRAAAEEKIQRALIRRGRRPHLIFDPWELADAHVECTLGLIFSDFASSIGDGRYKVLADGEDGKGGYNAAWQRSFDACQFRYDTAETGGITTNDTVASSPSVVVTAGRPGQRRYYGRGVGGPR